MNDTTLNNPVPAPSTAREKAVEDAPTIPVGMNYRLSLEQIATLTDDMENEVESEQGESENKSPAPGEARDEN